jgi:hypothetical protein
MFRKGYPRLLYHACHADWPKEKNFVTGIMEPETVECSEKNTRGRCALFEDRFRFWPWLFQLIIDPVEYK